MSRPATPICKPCQTPMRCEHNDTPVELMASFGSYELWMADTYKCPKCGTEVLGGFAEQALSEHWQPDHAEMVAKFAPTVQVR